MGRQRLFLIINPISGTNSKAGLADRIEARLRESGYDVTTAYTTGSGDATRLARQAVAEGYDGVLACGGDGTVNETARAMLGTSVPMGIIPAGSGNGLARHMGIPVDAMMSLDVIAENYVVDCDYATANGEAFFCTFGVGFDAAVSHRFAHKSTRGKMTYIKSAMEEYLQYRAQDYSIEIDGKTVEEKAFLVAVCNASQYGNNAFIAPHASITDGLLDVIVVKESAFIGKVLLGFDMMTGLLHTGGPVSIYRTNRVVLRRNSSGPVHLDGEAATMGKEIDVKCVPGRLRLFATISKTRFRPIVTPVNYMLRDWRIALGHLFG